jgi:hypothetical protein
MRERVEDLGRIAVMIEHVLDLDVFCLYSGRNKDFYDYFLSLTDEDRRFELLDGLIRGLSAVRESLSEISAIAEGMDRLNELS